MQLKRKFQQYAEVVDGLVISRSTKFPSKLFSEAAVNADEEAVKLWKTKRERGFVKSCILRHTILLLIEQDSIESKYVQGSTVPSRIKMLDANFCAI